LCRGRRGSDGLGGGVVPTRGVVSDAILQSFSGLMIFP
jgi:hypothetical protein